MLLATCSIASRKKKAIDQYPLTNLQAWRALPIYFLLNRRPCATHSGLKD
jgi:hypothetical protein